MAHLSVSIPRKYFNETEQISRAVANLISAGYLVFVSCVEWLDLDEFAKALHQQGVQQAFLQVLVDTQESVVCFVQTWMVSCRFHPEIPPAGFYKRVFLRLTSSEGAATAIMYGGFAKDPQRQQAREQQIRTQVIGIIEGSLGKRIPWEPTPPSPFIKK